MMANVFPKNIDVPVAHKIGDAYDFKHDVAIVYADSPFILSIFTDKEGYDKITSIADDVYGIFKIMTEKIVANDARKRLF